MKNFSYLLFVFLVMISLSVIGSAAAIKSVDSVMYSVNPDGTFEKEYTGWAAKKSTGEKYYYKNGIKRQGWQTIGNRLYYFNHDGIMRTGSVHVDSLPDSPYQANIIIDESGAWDGKTRGRYRPETLNHFLLDYNLDLLDTVKVGNTATVAKEIDAVDYLVKVLKNNSNEKTFLGYSSEDEIESPTEWSDTIKSKKLWFFKKDAGKSWWVVLDIGKDAVGNTWIYEVNGNWTVKLANNPRAYDAIASMPGLTRS